MACSISSYSGGDNRVETNLPRFSFFGSAGLPTFGVSLIKLGSVLIWIYLAFLSQTNAMMAQASMTAIAIKPVYMGPVLTIAAVNPPLVFVSE
jgi:hypothetical protein